MRRVVISAAASAMIAPLLIVGTTSQANAATDCYESTCTGLVAANTNCVKDAYVAKQANIYNGSTSTVIGYVQLEYSPTCRSTWARVITDLNYGSQALVQRNNGNLQEVCYGSGPAGTGCNTEMINDAGFTSYAGGYVFVANGNAYTNVTASF